MKKKNKSWCFHIGFFFASVNGCGTLLPITVTTHRIRGKNNAGLGDQFHLWTSDEGRFNLHQCVKTNKQTHFILIITCKEQAPPALCFVAFSFPILS